MSKPKWLATTDAFHTSVDDSGVVIIVSADTSKEALEIAVKRFLKTEYDKKYSAVVVYAFPKNTKDLAELARKLIISNGEYFEYFGRPSITGKKVEQYCLGRLRNAKNRQAMGS